MATNNTAQSSTNNVNFVLYNYSTAVEYISDRKASSTILMHTSIERIENLGVSVTKTNPFTNKTS